MGISIWQLLIVLALVVLLFGRGKISELMGDVAKGVTSFRKGLREDDEPADAPKTIEGQSAAKDAETASDRETLKS